jgi:hypothetical protein
VSEHFNGWGGFPNPGGFTQDKVHGPFEGAFVRQYVSAAEVRRAMPAPVDCRCPIAARTAAYLAETNRQVRPFFELYKQVNFAGGDPRWRAFATRRLAASAAELRDDIAWAWRESLSGEVGYPPLKVADVLAGRIDPFDPLYGED